MEKKKHHRKRKKGSVSARQAQPALLGASSQLNEVSQSSYEPGPGANGNVPKNTTTNVFIF